MTKNGLNTTTLRTAFCTEVKCQNITLYQSSMKKKGWWRQLELSNTVTVHLPSSNTGEIPLSIHCLFCLAGYAIGWHGLSAYLPMLFFYTDTRLITNRKAQSMSWQMRPHNKESKKKKSNASKQRKGHGCITTIIFSSVKKKESLKWYVYSLFPMNGGKRTEI